MRRAKSLEMTLLLGKIEGTRRREQQDETWLDGVTDLMDISLSKLQEIVKYREAWHAADHGSHKESDMTEQLHNNKALGKKTGGKLESMS